MQGEDFGGGVRVSVDRRNGTGVRPAEQEGVALLGGGVTWARARGGRRKTTTTTTQQLISQCKTKLVKSEKT